MKKVFTILFSSALLIKPVKSQIFINNTGSTNNTDPTYRVGKVAIGKNTPATDMLDVNGNIVIPFGNYIGVSNTDIPYKRFIQTGWDATNGDFLSLFTSGTSVANQNEKIRILSNGNIGFGTTTPQSHLDIQNASLGLTANSQVEWQQFSGASGSGNNDYLKIFQKRGVAGSNWYSSEVRIQKKVDATDMHYISFKGSPSTESPLLTFGYGNVDQMAILLNGNVGIGTTTPAGKLEVVGWTRIMGDLELNSIKATDYSYASVINVNRTLTKAFSIFNSANPLGGESMVIWGDGKHEIFGGVKTDKYLAVLDNSMPSSRSESFVVYGSGKTEIKIAASTADKVAFSITDLNTNKINFRVKADGFVHAREVEILNTAITFPDYVFAKDYKLLSLNELESYIYTNKHLPSFENAAYYETNGIRSSEMFVKQQEKIEELTLYIIELEKRLKVIEDLNKH